MTYAEFDASLTQHTPPAGLSPLLLALWHTGRDEWAEAHDIAQDHEGEPAYDWLHALLHRQEGDTTNAAYWYRRAGRPAFDGSTRHEWQTLVKSQLKEQTK
ncbi:hypothetical protein J0X19_23540 [Hymenobacter sp. BT186]|uniref:Uncharacterized protein n=1 Tax=Hymenobacter telluris TaxID=2816474 RepID=A0A939JBI0_9BACT|nr:hypothetical protein [Hymenobacter telluris]MBO0360954.1 hypothetical protein [Hymenobacter telluris]MBW3376982.1 hypothetical protein [Hymenobacter norwichensis]